MKSTINYNLFMRKVFIFLLFFFFATLHILPFNPNSVYTQRPDDPEAYYFTPENYRLKEGEDVSEVLQNVINQLKREKNFGILFIPEGQYRISKTYIFQTQFVLLEWKG